MLIIIAFHFSYHGGFGFASNLYSVNKVWLQFTGDGAALGNIGNDIFVFLAGYFLVESRCIKWRRLINLWAEVFFYSVLIFMLFVFSGMAEFSVKDMIQAIFPIVTSSNWFASYYFGLYLIHPFLNDVLHDLKRENYIKLVFILLLCWSVTILANADIKLRNIMNFVCLYCIAGYVRLWCSKLKGKKYILLGIGFMLMNYFMLRIFSSSFNVGQKSLYPVVYFNSLVGIFIILAALCMLIGFNSLKIPHSKIINLLASATFGVYLIHDNNFVRPFLWHKVFMNASFQNSPYLIPYSIGVILLVYVVCTLIELTRSRIFKMLSSGYLS